MTGQASAFSTDFAADFPADEAGWRKAAETALKGKPLDAILRRELIDGVAFEAIAPRAPARPIAGRAAGARWTAMTRIDLADPAAANEQALEDLNNGASGLSLALAGHDDRGVAADTLDRLDQALDGVMLDLASLHVEAPRFGGRPAAALVAALVQRRGLKTGDATVLFGLDLLRDLARTGAVAPSWTRAGARLAGTVKGLLDRGYEAPVLMIDQRVAHDAGASEAQEIAGALASAVEHIRVLGESGLAAEQIADTIAFAFACDADQFATIAKLRAARLVWAAVRREIGLGDRALHIHAETSRRMMTRKDPQSNIIRTTVAAFAAGVGGADSVVVLPHTFALGGADGDARRIARNAQAIVLEESNAYRVADPAAGAGAIEALTDALAESAWDLFREIERGGGMRRALENGAWRKRIAETQAKREKMVATRKSAIVGVSEFPKADEAKFEAPQEQSAPAAQAASKTAADDTAEGFSTIVDTLSNGASIADVSDEAAPPVRMTEPLRPARLAEPFERLRAENEARDPQPKAFLALIGPIARHGARAGFIRNLLDAGGVASVDGPVEASTDEVVAAYDASGARLAVACGADADYAEAGAGVAKALAAHGAVVWLAGRPKDIEAELEQSGVARFIAAGDDAIEILAEATAIATRGARGQGDAS